MHLINILLAKLYPVWHIGSILLTLCLAEKSFKPAVKKKNPQKTPHHKLIILIKIVYY